MTAEKPVTTSRLSPATNEPKRVLEGPVLVLQANVAVIADPAPGTQLDQARLMPPTPADARPAVVARSVAQKSSVFIFISSSLRL
jgi:hypothetical protein